MRLRSFPAALLLLGSWACSGDRDLPPEYRQVAVPEARLASAAARRRGRALFLEHCAICHGERADGRGVRQSLSSQPADFTDPAWRRRTSPRRVYFVLREGVHGTAMPAWKVLDPDQTWDLVAYVLSVAEEGAEPPGG
jgi:mono/diheme cytochrome c family protein